MDEDARLSRQEEVEVTVERPLPVEGQSPRIEELWAWTAIDPMTDVEGIIGIQVRGRYGTTVAPAVVSVRRIADLMEPRVRAAIADMAEPRPTAQLRRFVPAED